MVVGIEYVKINYVCILGQYVDQSNILRIIETCLG